MKHRTLAEVTDYDSLMEAFRARTRELKVTMETIDEVTGLQAGYAGKLLAPVPMRAIGRVSLGPLLTCLGLRLVVVEDLAALKKIERRLSKRLRPVRDANVTMPTRKRRKSIWKGVSEWGRLMSARRILKMEPAERVARARRAARVRWRKAKRTTRAASCDLTPGLAE